jgi:hypothetical protein
MSHYTQIKSNRVPMPAIDVLAGDDVRAHTRSGGDEIGRRRDWAAQTSSGEIQPRRQVRAAVIEGRSSTPRSSRREKGSAAPALARERRPSGAMPPPLLGPKRSDMAGLCRRRWRGNLAGLYDDGICGGHRGSIRRRRGGDRGRRRQGGRAVE